VKVLFIGDAHGNTSFMTAAIERAKDSGVTTIVQLGDFGFWPHTKPGVVFLADVERAAANAGVTVYWLDGNHENHDLLSAIVNRRTTPVPISKHVRYLPRGCRWEWAGVRFAAFGGAFSIDRRNRHLGQSWWHGELVTADDLETLGDEPVDVLLTHEAPAGFEFKYNFTIPPTDQATSDEQRRYIARAVTVTRPRLVIHGHRHQAHRTMLNGVDIIGLSYDEDPDRDNAFYLLDLTTINTIASENT
jgi:Icc-related predicted phosphoesterase